MRKKLLAIIMSVAMAVAFMPTLAFANDVTDRVDQQIKDVQSQHVEKAGEYAQQLYDQIMYLHSCGKDVAEWLASEEGQQAINDYLGEADGVVREVNRALQKLATADDTKAAMKALEDFVEALEEFHAEFKDAPEEILEIPEVAAFIEQAESQIEKIMDEIVPEIEKAVNEQIDAAMALAEQILESEEFDQFLEQIGQTKEEIMFHVMDIVAYAEAISNGDPGYIESQTAIELLKADVDDLEAQIDDLNQLVKELKNALKVQLVKGKLVKKQTKSVKKSKAITVTYQDVAPFEGWVDGYQVYIQKGKKAKNSKVFEFDAEEGFQQTIDQFMDKNMKKGQKYKVKVRPFVYVDGEYYYGQFSKVKKVKVR